MTVEIVALSLLGLLVGIHLGPALALFYEAFLEMPIQSLKAKVFPHVLAERREQDESGALRLYAYSFLVRSSQELDPARRESFYRLLFPELFADEHDQRQGMGSGGLADDKESPVDA